MRGIGGYQLGALLHESSSSTVYRAQRDADGRPVVIKMLRSARPTPESIARFRYEYETTRMFADVAGVVDVLELRADEHRWWMAVEDFGGVSLDRRVGAGGVPLDDLLPWAVTLAEIVGQVHQRRVVHKDINPSNIVVDAQTGTLKLIDFGISTRLSHESPGVRDPSRLEGTLAYMSPEQTGRMNRSIDYRTDFYSLGVTLYELATGRLPLSSTDAMELVHFHLARTPAPPHELEPRVPRALSAVILKLLEKNAEDRYQSAHGLHADLERCRQAWREDRPLLSFTPGQRDVSDRFQLPQKLYGRDRERQALLDAFARVGAGARELVLIAGYSGVGKSSLVHEMHRPLTRRRGYFIHGKFDQLNKNAPYDSLVQAFRALIRQLLTESEEALARWRTALGAALGTNAQVIIDVIPEVELILGPQPPCPPLDSRANRARFGLMLLRFVGVFTTAAHPLVLFLDDLQWADNATLELLEHLIDPEDESSLLLIGAYRDNEVSESHPLMLALRELRAAGGSIHDITLGPLSFSHVAQMLADTVLRSPQDTEPLARLVLAKTGGNPFFLGQFLHSLHREGLLVFDGAAGRWRWDLARIEAEDMTDNVVELMAQRVESLGAGARQAVTLAACIGNRFGLRTLATVYERSPGATARALWEALAHGLVVPRDERYRYEEEDLDGLGEDVEVEYAFAHDRIQQAALSLLSGAERRAIHWRVGSLLLEGIPAAAREARIFDVVNHLNLGLEHVPDRARAVEIAELDLVASRKAKDSAAYGAGLRYAETGIELLCGAPGGAAVESAWAEHYELVLGLHRQAAESACAMGAYARMDEWVARMRAHARDTRGQVQAYRVEIQAHAARQALRDGIEAGLAALALLGVELPEEPDLQALGEGFARAAAAWSGMDIDALADLPPLDDERVLAALEILASLYIPAFNGSPQLFALIVCTEVILTIEHGLTPISSRCLVAYGFLLCAQGEIEGGHRFGRLALRLAERFDDKGAESSTLFMFYFFINQWKAPIADALEHFPRAHGLGLDAGDLEFAALNLCGVSLQSFWSGRELGALLRDARLHSQAIRELKQELPQQVHDQHYQLAMNFAGVVESPLRLVSEVFDEAAKEPLYLELNNVTQLAILNINRMVVSYCFGEPRAAAGYASQARHYVHSLTGMTPFAQFHIYDSLVQLAVLGDDDPQERERALAQVADNQALVSRWAAHAPMNFAHAFHLVEAERARVLGRPAEARELYDQAIVEATESGVVHQEALAHELAAAFHAAQGRAHLARHYLRDAHYAYQRWGAAAKVADLEARFPALTAERARPLDAVGTASTRQTERQHAGGILDLASVLEASRAISRESALERLLSQLLDIAIKNAGAQRGLLILDREGELVIEAESSDDGVRVLHSTPVAGSKALCSAIVNLVARTRTAEVVNDATRERTLAEDEYVRSAQPKSILCMPLVDQGRLTALLYLENNLSAGTFTRERLDVLQLLSAEMAISIDNARLLGDLEAANAALEDYSHTLERRVEERTLELADKNLELERTLERLRRTQEHLIRQEKLASLGTLTAGIAHEMRNPLNFINNFSSLSVDLVGDLTEVLTDVLAAAPADARSEVEEICQHLAHNASTIMAQGKRAGDIVDTMLLHTHSVGRRREPADINQIVRRATQLAYEGMRAKEAALQVEIHERCDASIGEIVVVPEDIERVLINLVDNACYATHDKARGRADGYRPMVWITTEPADGGVRIEIRDNGAGVPAAIREQVFTPFFTTKPAGKGTGLGLSLSYDIVVNKHGGEILMDTVEGSHATFTIYLPAGPSSARRDSARRDSPSLA
ncbi:MAG: AAA family ATPase [Myxococcales bacterium]|nr:AAA family ATPase [Myxococcales bacterium]